MDERSRLAIPAKLVPDLRKIAGVGEDEPLEVVISITKQKRLGVYPRRVYDKKIAVLTEQAKTNPKMMQLKRAYNAYADVQTIDKQNRFRVPSLHAGSFNLSGEVVVIGQDSYLEVVSTETWIKQIHEDMELASEADVFDV